MVSTKLVTAEELERLSEDERYELIRGELRPMSPTSRPHGRILGRVSAPLITHVDENCLGMVYVGDVGIVLETDPDTVLAPDIAFVRGEPHPLAEEQDGYFRILPTLVVEIASPSDTRQDLRDKARRYREAGVPNVWLVEYRTRSMSHIDAAGREQVLGEQDTLDGGDLIPGFRLPIADIFR